MVIRENNDIRFVAEYSSTRTCVILGALNLLFLFGISMFLENGGYLHTIVLTICLFAGTTLMVVLVGRYRLVLDRVNGTGTVIQWGFHRPRTRHFQLPDLNNVEVQTFDKCYRILVHLKSSAQPLALTPYYVDGAPPVPSVDAANSWLSRTELRKMFRR